MNAQQWKLILETEIDCVLANCNEHQPELAHDILPQFAPLAQLQTLWYLAGMYD